MRERVVLYVASQLYGFSHRFGTLVVDAVPYYKERAYYPMFLHDIKYATSGG
jgi:hypothetical protein